MKIPLSDVIMLYEQIVQKINIEYVSVVIFAGLDVDSLCTLKILGKFFKAQQLMYKVYPVSTYSELELGIQKSKAYDQVKMFFFINCGGLIDLTNYWFIERAKTFVLDINKPIYHTNLQSQDIYIIDDGSSEFQNCPSNEQYQKLLELEEYDLDSDAEQDQEEDASDNQTQKKEDKNSKRANRRKYKSLLRKHKAILNDKVKKYYGKYFFSLPSSYTAYMLVRDLHKANNDYLWYSIVGMVSMFLEQSITKEMMASITDQIFKTDALKFNSQGVQEKKEVGSIASKRGFQFTLMDHWSLYESMTHSNYMMIKLKLYEDFGLNKLNEFLTKIGISLNQAKQLYKYMKKDSKELLNNKVMEEAEKMKLYDVVFSSFSRQIDSSVSFMASDYYYLLIASLEHPHPGKLSFQELADERVTNFWKAYDIFDASPNELKDKIQDYKKMSTIVMKQAKSLIERQHIMSMNKINFANIRSDSLQSKLFEHPLALIRLAYILMGIMKEKDFKKSKGAKMNPFIASYTDNQKGISTVVGVTGGDSKNPIGNMFNNIADKLKISVKHDSFLANIIIIPKESLLEFIKEIGEF